MGLRGCCNHVKPFRHSCPPEPPWRLCPRRDKMLQPQTRRSETKIVQIITQDQNHTQSCAATLPHRERQARARAARDRVLGREAKNKSSSATRGRSMPRRASFAGPKWLKLIVLAAHLRGLNPFGLLEGGGGGGCGGGGGPRNYR